jgi:5'-3' exonuclease
MGIQGLNNFLKEKIKDVHREVHLSNYKYKKMAVDTSLYMFKFKTVFGDKWISAFINLVVCLRRNDIHCVFVYDTVAPIEKTAERNERKEKREKMEREVYDLECAFELYKSDGILSEALNKLIENANKKERGITKRLLLNTGFANSSYLTVIQQEIDIKKKQSVRIDSSDFELTRKLFDIMNIPWMNAPSEAEAYCSAMCIDGIVDCVLSEDSDVLAYGSPIFLSKINTSTDTVVEIIHSELLEKCELSKGEFVDFCIMCGTDYNKNIPKVGPVLSYKLIKEYKSIDNIPIDKYDTSVLNHVRGRELFNCKSDMGGVRVKYCKEPDYNKLEEFCFINNCRIDISQLKKACRANLVFV